MIDLYRLLPSATYIFYSLIVIVFSSCSIVSQPSAVVASAAVDADTPIVSTPQSPFSLQVTSVQNDGKTLKVEGIIITKASWYVDKVSLNLVGYHDGVEVASFSRPLKDFLNPSQLAPSNSSSPFGSSNLGVSLPAETPLAFSLGIPSQNITDYQLTLGWGEEAVVVSSKSVNWVESGIVDLGVAPDCSGDNCGHFFAVEGTLQNIGKETINSVSVAIGLLAADSIKTDTRVDMSEYEMIELTPLNISPGASQKVRLRFKKAISPEQALKIKPDVRIKSFK